MRLKSMDVNLALTAPLIALCRAFESTAETELVITSGNDGKHKENSLHYKNLAIDIRVKNQPGYDYSNDSNFEQTRIVIDNWIRRAMRWIGEYTGFSPEEFDIVFGDSGHKNHIHAEYDPR